MQRLEVYTLISFVFDEAISETERSKTNLQ